jgi:hypothetical protein
MYFGRLEATGPSKMIVPVHQTTCHHKPKAVTLIFTAMTAPNFTFVFVTLNTAEHADINYPY